MNLAKDRKDYIDYGACAYAQCKMNYYLSIKKYIIKKIIVNKNAVIVFFEDGQKTVVKKMDSDADDIYSAVAQAVMKKMYGSTNAFHKIVDTQTERQVKI